MKKYLYIIIFTICFSSCTKKEKIVLGKDNPTDLPSIILEIPEKESYDYAYLNKIDSIEYITLESVSDLQSIFDYEKTDQHIFASVSHLRGLCMFDRQGHFQQQIATYGYGDSLQIKLIKDSENNRLYFYGRGVSRVYSLDKGASLGEAHNLFSLPPQTEVYPLPENRFMVCSIRKVTAAPIDVLVDAGIYNEKGNILTETIRLSQFEETTLDTTWIDVKSMVARTSDGYYLFTRHPNAPYHTIYKADKDTILPAFYMNISPDMTINRFWVMDECLYFMFSDNVRKNHTIYFSEYNCSTKTIKTSILCKNEESNVAVYINRYARLGFKHPAPFGYPVNCEKYFPESRFLSEIIYENNAKKYYEKNNGQAEEHSLIHKFNKGKESILIIYHTN